MVPRHRTAAASGLPRRLARLGRRSLPGGGRVFVARSFRHRLLGLMLVRGMPARTALLIVGADSIHTAWMRFAIDVVFVDADGVPLRVVHCVRPWRVVGCRGAAAALELAGGQATQMGYEVGVSAPSSPPAGARASPGRRRACRA